MLDNFELSNKKRIFAEKIKILMKQVVKKNRQEANKDLVEGKLNYHLVIDGNSILKSSLVCKEINSQGKEYGAILNMLRRMGELLKKKDFDYCTVMWDGFNSGILRASLYPLYKANRDKHYEDYLNESEYDRKINDYCKRVLAYHANHKQPTKSNETDDESFQRQRSIIQNILDELFVRQFIFENVEGDDLIAYYVNKATPSDRIVIVSEDRDITQLISSNVCIWIPSLHKFITDKNDVEELGYTHENVVLKKMICGDQSDNIFGVKGLAEKGLLKLFPDLKDKKGNLDDVLKRANDILVERKENKKKPLKSLENMINQVTDGCQGNKLFEINKKIIDLSVPLLTDEAKKSLDEEIGAPIDISERSINNVYTIVHQNCMERFYNSNTFGQIFGSFERIIKMETNRYNNSIK